MMHLGWNNQGVGEGYNSNPLTDYSFWVDKWQVHRFRISLPSKHLRGEQLSATLLLIRHSRLIGKSG